MTEKFKRWLYKTDPEGMTNLDAICMVAVLTVGLSIAFGLIIWASCNYDWCGCCNCCNCR